MKEPCLRSFAWWKTLCHLPSGEAIAAPHLGLFFLGVAALSLGPGKCNSRYPSSGSATAIQTATRFRTTRRGQIDGTALPSSVSPTRDDVTRLGDTRRYGLCVTTDQKVGDELGEFAESPFGRADEARVIAGALPLCGLVDLLTFGSHPREPSVVDRRPSRPTIKTFARWTVARLWEVGAFQSI